MTMQRGEAIVRAARGWLGVPFRPQGRDVAGLDCVGLVAVAFGATITPVPSTYAQRGGDPASISALIEAAGFARIAGDAAGGGDLLLIETGPVQWHLAIWTGAGFIHADARLRRVVEMPGWPGWPVAGVFRRQGEA